MENNFDNVMSKKTNEELINIVKVDFNKYQSAAIESANKEIILRNIDPEKFQEISEKLSLEKNTQEIFDKSIVSSTLRFVNFIIDFISFWKMPRGRLIT